jgi:alkylhydroperoxidase family enzyme
VHGRRRRLIARNSTIPFENLAREQNAHPRARSPVGEAEAAAHTLQIASLDALRDRIRAVVERRLSLPDDGELDEASRELLATIPPLNVARMLARTSVAPEYYAVLRKMFEETFLPAGDREVMLFRTSWCNGSTYEIAQHRAYGGLPPDVVDAILSEDTSSLDQWEQALCRMCDEMARDAKLTPSSVVELIDHYGDENGAARAIHTMAWFNMLNRYVDSTGVPLETGDDPYAGIVGPVLSDD